MSGAAPRWRIIRSTLLALEGFLGISALTTGTGIVAGLIRIPADWLENLPYPLSDVDVPALILAVVVGGSCLGVLALLLRSPGYPAAFATTYCALVATAWAVVQAEALGPATWLEPVYGALTLLFVGLAFSYLWLTDLEPPGDLTTR